MWDVHSSQEHSLVWLGDVNLLRPTSQATLRLNEERTSYVNYLLLLKRLRTVSLICAPFLTHSLSFSLFTDTTAGFLAGS